MRLVGAGVGLMWGWTLASPVGWGVAAPAPQADSSSFSVSYLDAYWVPARDAPTINGRAWNATSSMVGASLADALVAGLWGVVN